MLFSRTTLIAALAGLASVANGKVMESLRAVPEGWTAVGKPDPSLKLHFRIAMTQVCLFRDHNDALF